MRRDLFLLIAAPILCLICSRAAVAQCTCEGDINDDGIINIFDPLAVIDCVDDNLCGECVNDCDVDCDGDIDWIDAGRAWCHFEGSTDCCNKPAGACLMMPSGGLLPECFITLEGLCVFWADTYGGQYFGHGSATAACSSSAVVFDRCVGGPNDGDPCRQDSNCPSGRCHAKNRYLSVSPSDAGAGDQFTVLQVRALSLPGALSAYNGQVWYSGTPVDVPEGPIGGRFRAAPLQCNTGVLRQWGTEPLIHLHGPIIVPGAAYEVSFCTGVDGPCSMPPAVFHTAKFGDIVPPLFTLQPDFADIGAMVSKFQAKPGAVTKTRVQLQPNLVLPNNNVNFADISAVVGAFQGAAYSFPAAPCP